MDDGLRTWQIDAIDKFLELRKRDFLLSATPGAGKTRFALAIGRRLLDRRDVERLLIIVPTDPLRTQWVEAAHAYGIELKPVEGFEDYDKSGYDGCVATYAQLAKDIGKEFARRLTSKTVLAVIDEIHHAGQEEAWGVGLRYALEHATFRLAMTGTPWRRNRSQPIPFVEYDEDGVVIVNQKYEYGQATRDGVCRQIEFHAYDGADRWIDCGDVSSAQLGDELPEEDVPPALAAALLPSQPWIRGVLEKAAEGLDELRKDTPDAGGLVVAFDLYHAKAYALILATITGEEPTIVLSDDPEAKDKIDSFRMDGSRWLVAVRMVSEGVDIPRLAVGVFATKIRTPLFFRQVVGRLVRVRPDEHINARLYIPSVPVLTRLAREVEEELRHELAEGFKEGVEGGGEGQRSLNFREPLDASAPNFDSTIYGGEAYSPLELEQAERQCAALGIPKQFAVNLIPLMRGQVVPPERPVNHNGSSASRHKQEELLRGQIRVMVGKLAHRIYPNLKPGDAARQTNADLLDRGFPQRKVASIGELQRIYAYVCDWYAHESS